MKFVYTWLIISLGLTAPLYAQTLAEWPLDDSNNEQAINVAANITASDFTRGNGIGGVSYSTDGAKAIGWTTASSSFEVDYYEVCLTVAADQTASITQITFTEERESDGPQSYELYYSTDGFATSTLLQSGSTSTTMGGTSHTVAVNTKIHYGEQICFRWFAHSATSSTSSDGNWEIKANSVEVSGSVIASCGSVPTAGSVSISNLAETTMTINLTDGSGNARIVVMREGAAVAVSPYHLETYSGSATFGAGDQLAPDTYVLRVTAIPNESFNVSGLSEGANYYVSVFEYNIGGPCYQNTPATTNAATSCNLPTGVNNLLCSAGDGEISLLWGAPNCYDQVMVVASESPITTFPINDVSEFSASSVFGAAPIHPNLGAGVFPVYLGTGDQVTVTGLNNGTTYYFALFSWLDPKWSPATLMSEKPVAGCAELGGERIFINELHYENEGPQQDVGVEVAGPAGIDLSKYELWVYERDNPPASASSYIAFKTLAGIIDDEGDGTGAIWVPFPDLNNFAGSVALYNRVSRKMVQYLAYRHHATAQDGPAVGLSVSPLKSGTTNIVLQEYPNQDVGRSLQQMGDGDCPSDFVWGKADATPGDLNGTQTILPVVLLSFEAAVINEKVRLNWITASESQSDYFEIEHSTDGRNFSSIGKVTAAGTSNVLRDYELWHYTPASGINYYRLWQTDFDGTLYYHGVLSVTLSGKAGESIRAFPNPVRSEATVSWSSPATQLTLFDANGRLVAQKLLNGTAGSTTIDLSDLPAGMYLLRLEGSAQIESLRLIKT